MTTEDFQKRIHYKGELQVIMKLVCKEFALGSYSAHEIITVGYEDLNIILKTDKARYFVKIFADFRDIENCKRYIDIMLKAIAEGVQHPKLYKSSQGFLYQNIINNTTVRLCVLEFIYGKSFYSLPELPSVDDLRFLARQAAIINQLDVKPHQIYDSWAVVNFVTEFDKKKQFLTKKDIEIIAPIKEKFQNKNLNQLPLCFVHGDIIRTNVMRDMDGKLYILDFSVANIYPRIQELAVLFCDIFFNEKNPSNFGEYYKIGLSEYQKTLPLTSQEIHLLPLFIQSAHAMHIIGASYERKNNQNTSEENDFWITLGRIGLQFTLDFWK